LSTALVPLLLALATPGQPIVVSTPASPAAASPLTTRCAPLGRAGSDIECVVQQAQASAAPATVMRVTVTTMPGPCRALEAQAVALPAAATVRPAPAGTLPVVVQDAPDATCAR
jgi:hypothetical protein